MALQFLVALVLLQLPFRQASVFGPSILCFSVVHSGEQAHFLAQQFLEGIGIFSCDDYIIFSDVSSEVLFGGWKNNWGLKRWPARGPLVTVLDNSLNVQIGGAFSQPLNVPIYDEVWRKVYQDGRYAAHDWTVKLEVHTAFHPRGLRSILNIHCGPDTTPGGCESLYLPNDGPNLHGPVEALTSGAVRTLVESSLDICKNQMAVNWTNSAEDAYLNACFQLTNVKAVQEPNLLLDFDLHGLAPKCDLIHGAFWQFSEWGSHLSCMGQAGYSAVPDSPDIPAEIAWTRDLLYTGGWVKPKILCWVLVQNWGAEPGLMQFQSEKRLGVFACDDFLVISNVSARQVLKGQAWQTTVTEIEGKTTAERSFESVGGTLVNVFLNAGVFAKAWKKVFEDGRYRDYDWTVKVDADVVIVPERLRDVLHRHCLHGDVGPGQCGPKFLQNFGGDLRGPIEAFNLAAMNKLKEGMDSCADQQTLSGSSETAFIEDCTGKLGILPERDSNLLSDNHKAEFRPCDSVHAAFHPFKEAPAYMACLKQTGYYYIAAPDTSTMTHTTTRTTSTSSTWTKTSSTHTTTSATTTTITTTTITTTIPHIIAASLFHFEGRAWQHKLPPWFITYENYENGYPLALFIGGVFFTVFCVPVICVLLLCRRSAPAGAAPAAPTTSSYRRESEESDARNPLLQNDSRAEAQSRENTADTSRSRPAAAGNGDLEAGRASASSSSAAGGAAAGSASTTASAAAGAGGAGGPGGAAASSGGSAAAGGSSSTLAAGGQGETREASGAAGGSTGAGSSAPKAAAAPKAAPRPAPAE